MKLSSNNWIYNINSKNELSLNDKIKALLKIKHKLVLVQRHELERLRILKHKDLQKIYVDNLYEHYIINNLPKTYLT